MATNGECTTVKRIEPKAIERKGKGNREEVNYRAIAKMLASATPERLISFEELTNRYLGEIRELPIEHKLALRSAYIFAHKVPREEREDFFQEIAVTLIEHSTKDERLAYTVARCDWLNWWAKYKTRSHLSLDSVTNDDEGDETTLADTLIGEAEFEAKECDQMQAGELWQKLPENVKPLVQKRLYGQALTASERQTMSRFVRGQAVTLLLS